MKDNVNSFKVVNAIVPATIAAAAGNSNGVTVDRNGFDSVAFSVQIGAEGDTLSGALSLGILMEDSPDDATFSPVEAADVIIPATSTVVVAPDAYGQVFLADTGAEAPVSFKVGYRGGQRYVRLVQKRVGTHATGTPVAAVAILSHPQTSPA